MASLRDGVLYGHCDENVGASVVKSSDPNQRIPVTVVNHATTGSSWWKNSASPMKKRRMMREKESGDLARAFRRDHSRVLQSLPCRLRPEWCERRTLYVYNSFVSVLSLMFRCRLPLCH